MISTDLALIHVLIIVLVPAQSDVSLDDRKVIFKAPRFQKLKFTLIIVSAINLLTGIISFHVSD